MKKAVREFDLTTIGGRIAKLRTDAEMSQEQLAIELHFENKATLSSYETNRRTVPLDVVAAMAVLFGVTTDYLILGHTAHSCDSKILQSIEILISLETDSKKEAAFRHLQVIAELGE